MRIYCLCKAKLLLHRHEEGSAIESGVALSEHPMEVEQIGVEQFLTDPNGLYFHHFPNVDIRVCRNCGNRIALEA